MTDIEAQIAALRERAKGNAAAELHLESLSRTLRAAAAPEDDASAELRQIAMWQLERFEQLLRGND